MRSPSLAFSAFAADGNTEVDVAVLKSDVARGDVIAEADLEYKAIPLMRANGERRARDHRRRRKEARRALQSRRAHPHERSEAPDLVAKGSTVTMLFEAPGMRLSAIGRALTEGAEGDTITILNPTSYRKVEAVVIKPGTVRVGALDAHAASAPSAEIGRTPAVMERINPMLRSISRLALMVCTSLVFAACAGTLDKISQIGQAPPLSPIAVPPNMAAGGPVYVPQPRAASRAARSQRVVASGLAQLLPRSRERRRSATF